MDLWTYFGLGLSQRSCAVHLDIVVDCDGVATEGTEGRTSASRRRETELDLREQEWTRRHGGRVHVVIHDLGLLDTFDVSDGHVSQVEITTLLFTIPDQAATLLTEVIGEQADQGRSQSTGRRDAEAHTRTTVGRRSHIGRIRRDEHTHTIDRVRLPNRSQLVEAVRLMATHRDGRIEETAQIVADRGLRETSDVVSRNHERFTIAQLSEN